MLREISGRTGGGEHCGSGLGTCQSSRFPGSASMRSTCGYCDLCDHHRTREQLPCQGGLSLAHLDGLPSLNGRKVQGLSAALTRVATVKGNVCHRKNTCYCLDVCKEIFLTCSICDYFTLKNSEGGSVPYILLYTSRSQPVLASTC